MKKNVYDFDRTIYKGDSSLDFYFFCLKKYPACALKAPYFFFAAFLYLCGLKTKEEAKEGFFSFLQKVPAVEAAVEGFWRQNENKISAWYLKNKKEDIIISASPYFLLAPQCKKLNVVLIASEVNCKTGRYEGKNCYGACKVKKLMRQFPALEIEGFYSDSLSDAPLAALAQKAFFVKNGRFYNWQERQKAFGAKITKLFLSREFITFLFCGAAGTLSNFLFSVLFSFFIAPVSAYVCGYSLSLFVTYFLMAKLIYKKSIKPQEFLKFVLSYIPNFIILLSFVYAFITLLGFNKILVYALAGLLAIPVTFILVKVFAFGKKLQEEI